MNYIDIALLLICAVSIIVAVIKGFFHTLFDLFSKIIALGAAKLISNAYAETIYESMFKQGVTNTLYSKLEGVSSVDAGKSVQSALESIPDAFNGVMDIIGIDKQALVDKVDSMGFTGENLINEILENVVSPIAVAVCRALIFVIAFIVIAFILRIILSLVNKLLKKLPKLKKVDRVFGGLLGAVRGLMIMAVLIYLITFIAGFTDSSAILDLIAQSKIISVGRGALQLISGSV